MTQLVVLSERLSTRAKAQDRVVPVLLLNSAALPLPGMGQFVAPATLMLAACGAPSISSIRTELISIIRPYVIYRAATAALAARALCSSSSNLRAACGV